MPNKLKISGGPNVGWYIVTIALLLASTKLGLIWLAFNLVIATVLIVYHLFKFNPIIKSILDTDWYKLTMGQVVFLNYPTVHARYRFINRGKTQFPAGFDKLLLEEIGYMEKLALNYAEIEWLSDNWCLDMDYVQFLIKFRYNAKQVQVVQNGGDLEIMIEGPWKETIMWEVPLMALISELYFKTTNKTYDDKLFDMKTELKATMMENGDVKWSDFGTRRRFSAETQDRLNVIGIRYQGKGFLGTSNPYFAMKYNLNVVGTYAHEAIMAMQGAGGGARYANVKWLDLWAKTYDYHMRIALTDTLTTDVFLRDFDKDMATSFAGVRHDSGDPFVFAEKIIKHYESMGIDPKTKKIVFSDSLNTDKAIELEKTFGERIKCLMGIGTHLTNDCGHKPLNMVIKLTNINFGDGWTPVVKLSDDDGKHTGDLRTIEKVKNELGILHSQVL